MIVHYWVSPLGKYFYANFEQINKMVEKHLQKFSTQKKKFPKDFNPKNITRVVINNFHSKKKYQSLCCFGVMHCVRKLQCRELYGYTVRTDFLLLYMKIYRI